MGNQSIPVPKWLEKHLRDGITVEQFFTIAGEMK
jgi:hypothetical protein